MSKKETVTPTVIEKTVMAKVRANEIVDETKVVFCLGLTINDVGSNWPNHWRHLSNQPIYLFIKAPRTDGAVASANDFK